MAVPISNVTRRQVYAPSGAGGAGPYAFTFEILANTDIAVFKDDTLLTLTTHYTVVINANGTGSVTITAAGLALTPTSPTQYAIVGNRTIARTSDFTTGGDFFANTLNDELDQQTIFAQQNAEGVARSLAAPQTDPTSINMTLPRASLRANKALGFDASGNPVISDTLGTNRGNWAAGVLYYVRDIVKDTTNNNIWQVITQHTSSGSQPINTNADAAKWTLLVDAASATTSATNAAASASAASTSASNASTSASNASTSATSAASSASAASTSASNAAASYDSFDDRYLGPKATAPTLDNDGSALLTGALYWDTTLNLLRVYSGTAWLSVNAFTSINRTTITAFATQTVLIVAAYIPGTNMLSVYVNGVKLNASEYTETNSTTVTLTTGLALNDEVEVFSYQVSTVGSLAASSVTYTPIGAGASATNVQAKLQEIEGNAVSNFTGNGSTTTFSVAGFARSVYVAGVFQAPGSYTVTSTSITFSEAPPLNAAIQVYTSLANPFGGTIYAAQISGILAVANGGTNASSAGITAFNNITGYTAAGATGTTSTNLVFSTSPSITTPRVITSINDTNGNELIAVTATASAVNELTVANAAAGNRPTISATGSDTNIGINLTPKGTGDVTLSTGNFVIGTSGKGIDFSATAHPAGMTSELLDDYEEGTWTPIYESQSGSFGAITYVSVFGFYTKIGNVVYVSGQLVTDAVTIGTASGELYIGGLPFGAAQPSSLSLAWSQDFNTGNPSALGVRGGTLTTIRIFYRTSASGAALPIDTTFLQNGVGKNYIQFAGCYNAS